MKKINKSSIKKIVLATLFTSFAAYAITVGIRAYQIRKINTVPELSYSDMMELESVLNSEFPNRNEIIKKLPYETKKIELPVLAKSAIVIDATNGNILYEKNSEQIIPPASMTKIAVMYVVFQEIEKGKISLNDVVPLPPDTWACNMPPHSSLMFLGKNQKVTLEELLLGLAVGSGNDAAHAVANYVCGSMEAFIERMNFEVEKLGLTHTHFVEASGYSEKNTTTAKEMATLAKVYLEKYPESLVKFHSALSITYPQEKNLAPENKGLPRAQDFSNGLPEHITMGIYQKNTNPLLGKLNGCDGLKTGYIDESGYNLALTVKRGKMRIISVTMGGPGNNVNEGQAGRTADGTTITEWAFSTFADYENPMLMRAYNIPLVKAKQTRISLIPAWKPKALTIPVKIAENPENAENEVKINLELPKMIKGNVKAGNIYGKIEYFLGGKKLQSIPLVAQQNVKQASLWIRFADLVASAVLYF